MCVVCGLSCSNLSHFTQDDTVPVTVIRQLSRLGAEIASGSEFTSLQGGIGNIHVIECDLNSCAPQSHHTHTTLTPHSHHTHTAVTPQSHHTHTTLTPHSHHTHTTLTPHSHHSYAAVTQCM